MKKISFANAVWPGYRDVTRLLTAWLLCVLSLAASAHVVVIEDINHVLSKQQVSHLKQIIEAQCRFHQAHLGVPAVVHVPVRIFSADADYRSYQHKISKTSRSRSGFYSDVKKEIVVNAGQDNVRIIAHEAQHFILHLKFTRNIKWLDEGLSEYFEYADVRDGRLLVHEQPQKRKRLQQWLKSGSLPQVADFLGWSNRRWQENNNRLRHLSRSFSWGLVYFLMNDIQGRKALSATLRGLQQHPDLSPRTVLQTYYPGGIEELQLDFQRFLAHIPASEMVDF